MASKWADYGFPDCTFKPLEKLNGGLLRALFERVKMYFNWTRYDYYTSWKKPASEEPSVQAFFKSWGSWPRNNEQESLYISKDDCLQVPYNNYAIDTLDKIKKSLYPVGDYPISRYVDILNGELDYNVYDWLSSKGIDLTAKYTFQPPLASYQMAYKAINAIWCIAFDGGFYELSNDAYRVKEEVQEYFSDLQSYFICKVNNDLQRHKWQAYSINASVPKGNYGMICILIVDLRPRLEFYDPPEE